MHAEALLLLAQLVVHRPPGRSPYSFETMPECGLDPAAAACELKRLCPEPAFWCAKPRWSASRGAWVRVERREAALARYALWAERVNRVVRRLARCVADDDVADEDCHRVRWWGGTRDLNRVVGVLSIFEAGLAEGPMHGHPPLGRGADGEVCALGLMPQYAPAYATWLPPDERKRLAKGSYRDVEAWALRDLHGEKNLDRCLEISIRQIVRHRRACKNDWGMFAAYASGHCKPGSQQAQKTATLRTSLLNKMRGGTPALPQWADAEIAKLYPQLKPKPPAAPESAPTS